MDCFYIAAKTNLFSFTTAIGTRLNWTLYVRAVLVQDS
jgi:hypothetical protein